MHSHLNKMSLSLGDCYPMQSIAVSDGITYRQTPYSPPPPPLETTHLSLINCWSMEAHVLHACSSAF